MHPGKKAGRMRTACSALLAAGLVLSLQAQPAFAATTVYRDLRNSPPHDIVFDNLDLATAKLTAANAAISIKTTSNYQGRTAVVWNVSASGPKTLKNPFSVRFPNAGFDSKGNRVDLVVSCISCRAQTFSGKTPANREQVLIINDTPVAGKNPKSYLKLTSLPDKGLSAVYAIRMTLGIRVCKRGTDTPSPCSLTAKVADLDWYDETVATKDWAGTYAESVKLVGGYGPGSYITGDSLLKHASQGMHFYGSAVDGSEDRSSVTFTLDPSAGRITWAGSDCSTRIFETKSFSITSSAEAGGRISPQGRRKAGWKTSKAYKATADPGFKIGQLLVDGKRVAKAQGASYTYTFRNIAANHTIKASFVPISYSIAFDGNGASRGSTAPLGPCTYNKPVTLSQNGFVRPAHRFTGWNTAADGMGESLLPGQAVSKLTTEDGGRVTLYAQWEDVTVERTVTVRIPESDLLRAQAIAGSPPVVLARYSDAAEDAEWNCPIDLAGCRIEQGTASTSMRVRATENARCSLEDSALFAVASRTDIGLETIFDLQLPAVTAPGSTSCVVNDFPEGPRDPAAEPLVETDPAPQADALDPDATAPEGPVPEDPALDAIAPEGAAPEDPAPEDPATGTPAPDASAPEDPALQTDAPAPETPVLPEGPEPPLGPETAPSPGNGTEEDESSALLPGRLFNEAVPSQAAEVVFADTSQDPAGCTIVFERIAADPDAIDLSERKDGSILGLFEEKRGRLTVYGRHGTVPANRDCAGLLADRPLLLHVDASGLDTRGTLTLRRAFAGCPSLESADFSGCDTRSVEDAADMLDGCCNLKLLALGDLWSAPQGADGQARFPVAAENDIRAFREGEGIPSGSGTYRQAGTPDAALKAAERREP